MLRIQNLEEKELVVARYFIRNRKMKSEEYSDKDIFEIWMHKFPNDFKLRMKKFNQQKFVYVEDESGDYIELPDKRNIPRYVRENYNKLWANCCISTKKYISDYSLEDCDRHLTQLRKKHEIHLRKNCCESPLFCRIVSYPPKVLSKYSVEYDRERIELNYEQCLQYIRDTKMEIKARR